MTDRPDRRDKAAMGRWIGVPAGNPASGSVSRILIGDAMDSGKDSTKASGDGFYTTTDEAGVTHRFVVRKGDTVPEGATFEAGPQKDEPKTQPAQQAQQGKTGPSETTSANPPKQTS